MFSGIVEGLGEVLAAEPRPEGRRLRLRVSSGLAGLRVGESLALDGVCLTVAAAQGDAVEVDLGAETLRRTTLGALGEGALVNLERPVPADGRFGGHFVQGHVDGVGRVAGVRPEGEGRWMEVRLPPPLVRYVAEKGSLTLDGVSLTVARLDGPVVAVALIPHTLSATTLGRKVPGDEVNVEVDILAKYVERLLARGGDGGRRQRRQANHRGEEWA